MHIYVWIYLNFIMNMYIPDLYIFPQIYHLYLYMKMFYIHMVIYRIIHLSALPLPFSFKNEKIKTEGSLRKLSIQFSLLSFVFEAFT